MRIAGSGKSLLARGGVSCLNARLTAGSRVLPDPLDAIRGEMAIIGAYGYFLGHGLTDDQPVKRVAMMEGERGQSGQMSRFEGENPEAFFDAPSHEGFKRAVKAKFSQAAFDRDFPP